MQRPRRRCSARPRRRNAAIGGARPAERTARNGGGPGANPEARVPNHLVWAILATVFCCLPLGIVAIVKSVEVNRRLAAGDIAGARGAAATARTLVLSAAIVGAACIAFVVLDLATNSY